MTLSFKDWCSFSIWPCRGGGVEGTCNSLVGYQPCKRIKSLGYFSRTRQCTHVHHFGINKKKKNMASQGDKIGLILSLGGFNIFKKRKEKKRKEKVLFHILFKVFVQILPITGAVNWKWQGARGGGGLVFQAGYHPRKSVFKIHPKHVFFR